MGAVTVVAGSRLVMGGMGAAVIVALVGMARAAVIVALVGMARARGRANANSRRQRPSTVVFGKGRSMTKIVRSLVRRHLWAPLNVTILHRDGVSFYQMIRMGCQRKCCPNCRRQILKQKQKERMLEICRRSCTSASQTSTMQTASGSPRMLRSISVSTSMTRGREHVM